MGYIERLLAENLFLCIAWNVSFPNRDLQKRQIRASILIGNWPVVKLCKARQLQTEILSRFAQNLVELLNVLLQAECQKHSNRKPLDFRRLEESTAEVLIE